MLIRCNIILWRLLCVFAQSGGQARTLSPASVDFGQKGLCVRLNHVFAGQSDGANGSRDHFDKWLKHFLNRLTRFLCAQPRFRTVCLGARIGCKSRMSSRINSLEET